MNVRRLISVAKGETPADLLLANANIVNTLNGEIEQGNVALCGERIAGIGDYRKPSILRELLRLSSPRFVAFSFSHLFRGLDWE